MHWQGIVGPKLRGRPSARRRRLQVCSFAPFPCRSLFPSSNTLTHHRRHEPAHPPPAPPFSPFTLHSACARAPRPAYRGGSNRSRRLDPMDPHLPTSRRLEHPLPHWHGTWPITQPLARPTPGAHRTPFFDPPRPSLALPSSSLPKATNSLLPPPSATARPSTGTISLSLSPSLCPLDRRRRAHVRRLHTRALPRRPRFPLERARRVRERAAPSDRGAARARRVPQAARPRADAAALGRARARARRQVVPGARVDADALWRDRVPRILSGRRAGAVSRPLYYGT